MALRRSSRLLKDASAAVLPAATIEKAPRKRTASVAAAAASNSDGEGEASAAPKAKRIPKVKTPSASASAKAKTSGPSKAMELNLIEKGYKIIAGVDEAGRGPLCGPVVAAAAIVPPDVFIEGVDDSKKINSEEAREEIYERLVNHPQVSYGVAVIEPAEIDRINILQAALKSMEEAVAKLPVKPDYILVDGNKRPKNLPEETTQPVIKGDGIVYAISAASIIAKVTRDRIMLELDKKTEGKYGWAQNKGYPTADHVALLYKHGIHPEYYRKTFNPVKSMLAAEAGEAQEEGDKARKKGAKGKKAKATQPQNDE